ncbi:uncharacterized protein LOC118485591 isoform X2 [Helianthus annuus]|nr:uncharacterized protein LOC118485591 isoform X2 [Helianthus annuus]XP_035837773.1 uncharacterized protein LOC118485591 isoform X2 [Helianthus annuus]
MLIDIWKISKRQLSDEGKYTEEQLQEYMMSRRKKMIDSLWKLDVADIEATVSCVCQVLHDHTEKKRSQGIENSLLDLSGVIMCTYGTLPLWENSVVSPKQVKKAIVAERVKMVYGILTTDFRWNPTQTDASEFSELEELSRNLNRSQTALLTEKDTAKLHFSQQYKGCKNCLKTGHFEILKIFRPL